MTLGYPFRQAIAHCPNPHVAYKAVMWVLIAITGAAFIFLVTSIGHYMHGWFDGAPVLSIGFRPFAAAVSRRLARDDSRVLGDLFVVIMGMCGFAVFIFAMYRVVRVKYCENSILQFTLIGCLVIISAVVFAGGRIVMGL